MALNKNAVLIGAGALVAYAAWLASQNQPQTDTTTDTAANDNSNSGNDWLGSTDSVLTDASQSAAEFIDNVTGGYLKVSAMARVNPQDIKNPNVQAMLQVIRAGEGTNSDTGYRTLFGGRLFNNLNDHPNVTVKSSGYTSTAAGAYQMLASTWEETKRIMGLSDFSPQSQDLAALGRIAARGALDDVKEGKFETAVKKIAREWASLPGSPYGQPTITWERAKNIFANAGGQFYPV